MVQVSGKSLSFRIISNFWKTVLTFCIHWSKITLQCVLLCIIILLHLYLLSPPSQSFLLSDAFIYCKALPQSWIEYWWFFKNILQAYLPPPPPKFLHMNRCWEKKTRLDSQNKMLDRGKQFMQARALRKQIPFAWKDLKQNHSYIKSPHPPPPISPHLLLKR